MVDKKPKKKGKLEPPTNLEPGYLYEKYTPLRKSIYSRFKDDMSNEADRRDLMDAIDFNFIQLVREYDANIGVDFPYFIKKMLQLRIYHYVNKHKKVRNKEVYATTDEGINVEDNSYEELFERVLKLYSIDPDMHLGEKHSDLMIGLLIHKKTIKELAEEEGVPLERIHARLYFLKKKFKAKLEEQQEEHGEDLY